MKPANPDAGHEAVAIEKMRAWVSPLLTVERRIMPHSKPYVAGCPCDRCEAHRAYAREYRKTRVALGKKFPALIPHGTAGGQSNWGCSCADCRAASNAAQKKLIEKKERGQYNTGPHRFSMSSRPISV